ncbi:hypothetical protein D9M70_490160 [compost metagenome]
MPDRYVLATFAFEKDDFLLRLPGYFLEDPLALRRQMDHDSHTENHVIALARDGFDDVFDRTDRDFRISIDARQVLLHHLNGRLTELYGGEISIASGPEVVKVPARIAPDLQDGILPVNVLLEH